MITTAENYAAQHGEKHYRFRILGKGPTLLILGGPSDDWDSIIELLSSQFTLLIPSLSRTILAKQPGSSDPVFYLENLLEELAIEHYSVLAHSLSAWLGMRLAAAHPERVNKLILANLPSDIEDKSSFEQLHQVLAGKSKKRLSDHSSFWFDQIYAEANDLSDLQQLLRSTPFLMITGETDRFFSLEKFVKWSKLRDNEFNLEVIRFSGHFSMKDNPWYFSAIVKEFIQSRTYKPLKSWTA
jgi:pimeloyl-ACP methyl ester carboxylesterase